jgi:hypothetical protein
VRPGQPIIIPRQGSKTPWVMHRNYLLDQLGQRLAKLDGGVLMFVKAGTAVPPGTGARPGS